MNVMIVDSQNLLSQEQVLQLKSRVFFALAKFDPLVNGVTTHVSLDRKREKLKCTINVNVENVGIVSATRTNTSEDDAISLAVRAIESKIAFRVDWRAWINPEKISTWFSNFERRATKFFVWHKPSLDQNASATAMRKPFFQLPKETSTY